MQVEMNGFLIEFFALNKHKIQIKVIVKKLIEKKLSEMKKKKGKKIVSAKRKSDSTKPSGKWCWRRRFSAYERRKLVKMN